MKIINKLTITIAVVVLCIAVNTSLLAQTEKAKPSADQTLDALLERVKQQATVDRQVNQQREAEFNRQLNNQAALLQKAQAELNALEAEAERLKTQFNENEKVLSKKEEELRLAMGNLGELFGAVRQVAEDTQGQIEASIVSAQFPGRLAFFKELSSKKQLPDTSQLRKLWYELQREMTETGKVIKFRTDIVAANGETKNTEVVRVGAFNVLGDNGYLNFEAETQTLVELARQPDSSALRLAGDMYSAKSGVIPFALDPSRGQLLSMLIQAPSLLERYQQGGTVGYIITVLLFIGLILVLERMLFVKSMNKKIENQMASDQIDEANPLGQVMKAFQESKDENLEAFQIRMEEAVIKQTPKFERGLQTIKILAAVAPLLGLLGTVTGMILTFQSITMFGTGDPKLMAGGISQALITTVLGLIAAIPLLLSHNLVASRCKGLMQVLEEQAAGMMAEKLKQ